MLSNANSDGMLTAPSQRTLSDHVADQLRQAILAGQLKPNERLVEQEIAERMQTSRGPVRDGIKTLETEGLIVRQPHRGAFVSQLHLEDFLEIYTLREALETLAIQWVIQKANDQQLDTLSGIVNTMQNMAQHDYGQVEATDLDLDFHHTLVKISGHTRVLNAWESMNGQIRLVVLKHRLTHPDDLRVRSVSWHAQIVAALRERDAGKAIGELHIHMAASYEWVDAMFIAERQAKANLQPQSPP
jgi:DNA-binding GntR family transcriptional regulator